MVLPDAVDHDPGRERMVGVHQPAGQSQAAAGLLRSFPGGRDSQRRKSRGQNGRDPRFHPAAGAHGIAPPQDVGGRRAAAIPQGPNQGFGSEFGPEQLDLPGGFLRCLAVVRIDVFQVAESNLQTLFILAGQLLLGRGSILRWGIQHFAQVRPKLLGQFGQPQVDEPFLHRLGLLLERGLQGFDFAVDLAVVGLAPGLFFMESKWVRRRREEGQQPCLLGQHGAVGIVGNGRRKPVVLVEGPFEQGGQPVVVPLRDGVELVVVAAGAAHGQAQQAGAEDPDLLADDLNAVGHEVGQAVPGLVVHHSQETGGDQVVHGFPGEDGLPGQVCQLVPGQLLQQEAVVGLAGIERANDVVPVAVGVRAVGIAHQVQPVAAPALAVAGRVQQPRNECFVGGRIGVGQEPPNLLGFRRQSGQVKAGSPDQGEAVGFGREAESLFLEPGGNEGIHWVAQPGWIDRAGQGRWGCSWRLEGPEAAVFVAHKRIGPVSLMPIIPIHFQGAQGDPADELLQSPGTHRPQAGLHFSFTGRHFPGPDPLNDQALVGITGHDYRTRSPTLQHGGLAAQVQARLLDALAVTGGAVQQHQRDDVPLADSRKLGLGGTRALRRAGGRQRGDPGPEGGHLRLGRLGLFVRWHQPLVDHAVERTLLGPARSQDAARGAAPEKGSFRAQVESGQPGFGVVAAQAMGLQDGKQVGLKLGGRGRGNLFGSSFLGGCLRRQTGGDQQEGCQAGCQL